LDAHDLDNTPDRRPEVASKARALTPSSRLLLVIDQRQQQRPSFTDDTSRSTHEIGTVPLPVGQTVAADGVPHPWATCLPGS